MRLLVVEGNTLPVRQTRERIMGKTPAQSYADVLIEVAGGLAFSVAGIDIVNPTDAGAIFKSGLSFAAYDGIALTGSALQIYEISPEVTRQIDFVRAAFVAKVPIFGSCWGLQVATVAAGGQVIRNPLGREIGIARNIYPTALGEKHGLLKGRAMAYDAPCVHYDVVGAMPATSHVLAQNTYAVQAAEIHHAGGQFWGVQYHPEYDLGQIAALLDMARASLISEGFMANDNEINALISDYEAVHQNPSRRDIAWRLGLQPDILDSSLRHTELRNWLEFCVKPQATRARSR